MGISDLLNKLMDAINPAGKNETVESIGKIKIPQYSKINGMSSPTNNIEYILQRKATQYKKSGRMDLAIACLRKSNEIMHHSNFSYKAENYLRLVKYLKLNGQIEEAEKEEYNLRKYYPAIFKSPGEKIRDSNIETIKKALTNGYDLLQFDSYKSECKVCSVYAGKVFSISGKIKKYPKLPDFIFKSGTIHEGCIHLLMVYFEEFK